MSPITQDEAREALADIDHIAQLTRKAVAASRMGAILMLWGIVWFLGFALSYGFPRNSGPIWWVLSSLGMACTVLTGFLHHRKDMIRSAQQRKIMGQLALFWLAVFTYAMTLLMVFPAHTAVDELAFLVSMFMMAYVLMGIWLKTRLLIGIGLVVTAATLVGRALMPPRAFMLWMAVFGGGGLFVPGLYVKLRWK